MPRLNLLRQYTYEGKTYGPGPADVPEAAAASLREKDAEYKAYLDEGHEPDAPVTPTQAGGPAEPDHRLRKPTGRPPAAPAVVRQAAVAPPPSAPAADAGRAGESVTVTKPAAGPQTPPAKK